MNARVLGRAAEPVMVERLSSYLEKDLIYGSYRVCSFQAVQANTFVRIDRATQVDVNATLPNVAWRANGVTPDRRRVVGQRVLFEGCLRRIRAERRCSCPMQQPVRILR